MINWRKILNKILHYPAYKVISLDQDKSGNYSVTVQITRKGLCFKTTPERILSRDSMTDKFSPRDIRTLTYLGYLEINSPKYKILAKNLAKNDELVLILHKKNENQLEIKKASEVTKDKEIIKQLNSIDAHFIGYAQAIEDLAKEKQLKLEAKRLLDKKNKEPS